MFIILYIIVIDTKNRIINQITEECKNYYIKKLEVSNLISSKFNKTDKKYELNNNKSFLKDLNAYLPTLLKNLWENPIFVSTFLLAGGAGYISASGVSKNVILPLASF